VQTEDGRLLRLGGTRNLRDLGGYATLDGRRTRWRTLYRSDCLDQLDEAGQAFLVDAGLRTIVDVRDVSEVAARPNVFAQSSLVDYRHVAMFDEPLPDDMDGPNLVNGYIRELDLRGRRLAEIVAHIAAPEVLPMLFHCAVGKDRTGIVAALILAAIGVSPATIAEDYALSATCLGPAYLVESREWIARQGLSWARWAHVFETPPERMLKTLDYLDAEYGGAVRYLLDHGLEAERLAWLREALTEPTR
jgi:protein-tyrosine phosphatase